MKKNFYLQLLLSTVTLGSVIGMEAEQEPDTQHKQIYSEENTKQFEDTLRKIVNLKVPEQGNQKKETYETNIKCYIQDLYKCWTKALSLFDANTESVASQLLAAADDKLNCFLRYGEHKNKIGLWNLMTDDRKLNHSSLKNISCFPQTYQFYEECLRQEWSEIQKWHSQINAPGLENIKASQYTLLTEFILDKYVNERPRAIVPSGLLFMIKTYLLNNENEINLTKKVLDFCESMTLSLDLLRK